MLCYNSREKEINKILTIFYFNSQENVSININFIKEDTKYEVYPRGL